MNATDGIGRPLKVGDEVVKCSSSSNNINMKRSVIAELGEYRRKPDNVVLYHWAILEGSNQKCRTYNMVKL